MKLTEEEKTQLRNRISSSVASYIRRKRLLKYGLGLAAILVIAFFSKDIFRSQQPSELNMDAVVKSLDGQKVPNNVQLILNNNQSVEIAEDNAAISYSKTGEQVNFGNSETVQQNTSDESKITYNTLIVPYGRRSSITLSDGTKIWLNSGSKLVFPAKFIQNKREVYIEGEGIFEVAHDKKHPFIVKSDLQEIEVLGTVFNVSNYDDDESIATVLKSGSIRLSYQNNLSAATKNGRVITPGTKASYHKIDKLLEMSKVDVEKYFSWRDGIFIFKNDSMESIMKKIARYYNIEIVINDKKLSQTTFSGYLDVKDNVQNVIKTIQETTRFVYKIENNKLIINAE